MKIELDENEIQYVINSLSNQPFVQVAKLIKKIVEQRDAQKDQSPDK